MGEDQNQAAAAPQSAEDKLASALAALVEADTRVEHERHNAALALIDEQRADLSAKAAAEDARHVAVVASLRERAVAKLLAVATGAALPVEPKAPKAERTIRPKEEREADAEAIVAALTSPAGASAADIATKSGVEIGTVRLMLPRLVKVGRIVKIGEGRGVTYSLPPAAPASAGGAA